MIQQLLGPIVSLAAGFLERKAEEKRAMHERKLEIIKQDSNWENIQAGNSGSSWKDEWLTLLFSVPLVMAFFPSAVPYVIDGFKALEEMPEWYRVYLGVIMAASFGVRQLVNFKK
jgi:hypothetical protein